MRKALAWIAVWGALAALPLLGGRFISVFYTDFATKIFMMAILVVSYDLIAGYGGMISFGHAMFYGVGGYSAALILIHLSPSVWVALLGGVLASLIVGVVIGYFCIQTRGIYFVFLTLAVAQFFYLTAFHWTDVTGGSNGLPGIPQAQLFGKEWILGKPIPYYYFTLFFFLLSFAACRWIVNSAFGRALVAVRVNEERMEFLGYDVKRLKRRAFIYSSLFGGLAGALFAPYQNFVSPDWFHWSLSGEVIVITLLGGMGTLTGPAVGTAIVLLLGDQLSSYTEDWMIFVGGIYVLAVIFLPDGLWGYIRRRRRRRLAHVA